MSDIKNYIPGMGRGSVVTSSDTDPQFGQFISVTLGTSATYTMCSAPTQIIPAPGANYAVVVTDAILDISSGTAFTAGGATGLSFGGTANFIAGTVGSTAFFGTTGTTVYLLTNNSYTIPSNTGVYIANQSANFATGTESVTINCWYAVVPVSH